jgi:hypothetical protein
VRLVTDVSSCADTQGGGGRVGGRFCSGVGQDLGGLWGAARPPPPLGETRDAATSRLGALGAWQPRFGGGGVVHRAQFQGVAWGESETQWMAPSIPKFTHQAYTHTEWKYL